jgi:hypothetical protein
MKKISGSIFNYFIKLHTPSNIYIIVFIIFLYTKSNHKFDLQFMMFFIIFNIILSIKIYTPFYMNKKISILSANANELYINNKKFNIQDIISIDDNKIYHSKNWQYFYNIKIKNNSGIHDVYKIVEKASFKHLNPLYFFSIKFPNETINYLKKIGLKVNIKKYG